MKHGMSVIVKNVTRVIYPFLLLFGIYIIIHGHLTPGGGFSGGAIIASALIMMVLAFGVEGLKSRIKNTFLVELADSVGSLFSGGTVLLYNLGTGIHVAAGIFAIVLSFLLFDLEGREKPEKAQKGREQ